VRACVHVTGVVQLTWGYPDSDGQSLDWIAQRGVRDAAPPLVVVSLNVTDISPAKVL
jgi:hypothetical protein